MSDPTAGERECNCPCHRSTLNGPLPTHTGPCSCTVMSAEAVDLLNEVRDGDTTRLHAMFDADPLSATPDAGDASPVLDGPSFGDYWPASTSASDPLSEAERDQIASLVHGYGTTYHDWRSLIVRIVATRVDKARAEAGEQIAQALLRAVEADPWLAPEAKAHVARIAREVTR